MSYEIHNEPGFTVAGIFVKASNAAPELIGDLWRRFHAMGAAQSVKDRLDDTVYCVYCEYEGDWTQPYTVLIGCSVASSTEAADGLKTMDVAAGRFAVFQVAGELPKGVFEAWGEVWTTPFDRRYQADFDRYGADGVVSVHVGVR